MVKAGFLSRLRYHLPASASPTRINLIKNMQAAGLKATRWPWLAQFSEKHLDFSKEVCEVLEFKHTLAQLLGASCPEVMPETHVIDDSMWPIVLNHLADLHYTKSFGVCDTVDNLAWILKPALMNNGQHIKIFTHLTQIEAHFVSTRRLGGPHVLQRYVMEPDLHQKRKYSLRYFVVMTQKRGVFIYRHGYLNVAKAAYCASDFTTLAPHLTNEHLHAGATNVEQIPTIDLPQATVWYPQVKAMVSAVAQALQPMLHEERVFRHEAWTVFGFDLMLDRSHRLWLLEINHGPCFPIEDHHPLQRVLYDDFWQAMLNRFVLPIMHHQAIPWQDDAYFERIANR